jgi:hypothetical protein
MHLFERYSDHDYQFELLAEEERVPTQFLGALLIQKGI